MAKFRKKYLSALVLMLVLLLLSGCKTAENTEKTPAPTGTEEKENNKINEVTGLVQEAGSPTAAEENTGGKTLELLTTPSPVLPSPKAEDTEPAGSGEEKTETPLETVPDLPDSGQLEEINEAWNQTLLSWLPVFTSGTFIGTNAVDNFDYATFLDVSDASVIAYIDELVLDGFDSDAEISNSKGKISYSAVNDNDWVVNIDYSDGELKIGSGYFVPGETGSNPESIWSETLLSYLPEFKAGSYAELHETTDDGVFHAAVFNDVSAEEICDYILELKEAGFIYEVDEGDTDGFIWYQAENKGNIFCDITHSDGVAQIGCGSY